jgi:hypothetical protein
VEWEKRMGCKMRADDVSSGRIEAQMGRLVRRSRGRLRKGRRERGRGERGRVVVKMRDQTRESARDESSLALFESGIQ